MCSHQLCFASKECDLSKEQIEHIQRLTNHGKVAHQIGSYDEAIEAYSEAYRICNSPINLYNIAQAYRLSEQAISDIALKRKALRQAIIFYDRVISLFHNLQDSDSISVSEKARGFRNEANALLDKLPNSNSMLTPSPGKTPVYKKGWFWGTVVGSLAIVSLGVGIGVYYGTQLKDPDSDLGTFAAY